MLMSVLTICLLTTFAVDTDAEIDSPKDDVQYCVTYGGEELCRIADEISLVRLKHKEVNYLLISYMRYC